MIKKKYIINGSRSGACFHNLLLQYSYCINNDLEFGGLIVGKNEEVHTGDQDPFLNKQSICNMLGLPDILKYDEIQTKNIDIINIKNLHKTHDEKLFNNNFIKLLHSSCKIYKSIKQNYLTVGIHIRRGDVKPIGKWAERYLYNKYYLDLINLIKTINNNCMIKIFSESKSYESFEDFKLLNCNLYLDKEIEYTWTELINSNIFIMSKSSFSYVPAVYNKNIVIYHPFWHNKLPSWLDITDINFNKLLENSILNGNISL